MDAAPASILCDLLILGSKEGGEPSPLGPGIALEGAPNRMGLPAGPNFSAGPGKVPEGLRPHPPTDLVATPARSPCVQGVVQIQVGALGVVYHRGHHGCGPDAAQSGESWVY